jgi:hypothetical protein
MLARIDAERQAARWRQEERAAVWKAAYDAELEAKNRWRERARR